MTDLAKTLKRHEGFRDEVYLDSLGNPTCGWGHHLYPGSKVPLVACVAFFEQDMKIAMDEYLKIAPGLRENLNEARKNVIVNMLFNMGLKRVQGFTQMWSAIYDQDWDRAADEMLDSKWAEQVGKEPDQRAGELAEIMRKGKW